MKLLTGHLAMKNESAVQFQCNGVTTGPQRYIVPNVSLDFARNSEKKIDFRTQNNVKQENTYQFANWYNEYISF